ncbi:sugar phosphate isomerase/epimerase family protein [Methanococcus voltae]|uniref:Xylose isomerase domain protein TIM barrel n=1 Tax=Methanococcus voltae (strain ATCC BAA-1334 / A3) TaxID=456320 RepID=D7DUG6_METV3|nr:sugar phosphate isomerase/epimerase family protein [Methanococcus voltae]MCS3900576.1 sugar phosphate isomerase/epimerase [Methanococcus voltae]
MENQSFNFGKFNNKCGLSSLVYIHDDIVSSLEKISKYNFDSWEIVFEGTHAEADCKMDNILNLKHCEMKKCQKGLETVVHAPFTDLNPASLNDKVSKVTVDSIIEAIDFASKTNSKIVTVHPGYIPYLWKDYKERVIERNSNSIKKLVEVAETYDITIGLENMPNFFGVLGTTPEELELLTKGIDSNSLGITFDIGHANTCKELSNLNTEDYIAELNNIGKGIVHTHIHDNDGTDDSHLKLKEGNINLEAVFTNLNDINYNGIYSLECRSIDDAVESRRIISEILKDIN